ncbi:MAG: enoyl-CoA hydratase family protein [Planctomycetes bacterium]|nr:enoyl-CoA hydratase family protein [Planctomycetota bacterium]
MNEADPTIRLTSREFANYETRHVRWEVQDRIGIVTLDRPERKNPLTFESYAELRDLFRGLVYASDVDAVILRGNGDDFCSGGDVHEIIGPLVRGETTELLAFTRMTGDLVRAIRDCPQPVIAAIDGVCVGAGAILAMASDLRFGTDAAKVAFLFVRVGLAGCDMGACSILPRIIGQGRAAELLFSGRTMTAEEGERWGFFNRLCSRESLFEEARSFVAKLVQGPTFAHGMTKKQLDHEWNMSPAQAIEAEAQAQAICMQTRDFERAYHAFVAKQKPTFEGN